MHLLFSPPPPPLSLIFVRLHGWMFVSSGKTYGFFFLRTCARVSASLCVRACVYVRVCVFSLLVSCRVLHPVTCVGGRSHLSF